MKNRRTVLSDYGFPKYSWAHVAIIHHSSMTISYTMLPEGSYINTESNKYDVLLKIKIRLFILFTNSQTTQQ